MTQLTDGQRIAVRILMAKCGCGHDKMRLWVLSKLLERNFEARPLLHEDWVKLRSMAYVNPANNDWTIKESFSRRVGALVNQYREEVMGQLRLF